MEIVLGRFLRHLLVALAVVGILGCADAQPVRSAQRQALVDTALSNAEFVALSAQLSEPGGYFDTDNLISNESSYLHVIGALERLDVKGGAYLGVGPDQNFSYMARVRPAIAFIIDIRRDNLLEHLLFKSLFSLAETRAEFLTLLVGRRPAADLAGHDAWTIENLIARVDGAEHSSSDADRAIRLVRERVRTFGMDLSNGDLGTIERFHRAFIDAGLDLRFASHFRAPRPYYPTYRRLLLEHDLDGRQTNYLAREEDYQYLRDLQRRNLVVPVVGDLAGDHALRAIASWLRDHDLTVSAFYTSNVEFYLMQSGTFDRFAGNVEVLPTSPKSMIIRSYFGSAFRGGHPRAVPGYFSTQLLQSIESMVRVQTAGGYRSYYELVTRDAIPLN